MTKNYPPYLYTKGANAPLDAELTEARKFAKVKLGTSTLFWRAGLKQYAIPLNQVQRIHRRINSFIGRLCAGGKQLDVQYLVLILHDGTELVLHIGDDVKNQAEALFAALQETHPEIKYGKE